MANVFTMMVSETLEISRILFLFWFWLNAFVSGPLSPENPFILFF